MNNICELIQIGNDAKNVGNYMLANSSFAVAIEQYLYNYLYLDEKTDGNGAEFRLALETQNESGAIVGECHYDLLEIVAKVGDKFSSLCIPIPLLNVMAVTAAFKAGIEMIERYDHDREVDDDGDDAPIIQKFTAIIDVNAARNACYILGNEEEADAYMSEIYEVDDSVQYGQEI